MDILDKIKDNAVRQVARIKEDKAYRIKALKSELEATDYKIIKCAESFMQGKALPYNLDEVSTVRQAIRDKINALEG